MYYDCWLFSCGFYALVTSTLDTSDHTTDTATATENSTSIIMPFLMLKYNVPNK